MFFCPLSPFAIAACDFCSLFHVLKPDPTSSWRCLVLCCPKSAPVGKESRKESCDVLPGSEAAASPCFLLAVAKQACWQFRLSELSH